MGKITTEDAFRHINEAVCMCPQETPLIRRHYNKLIQENNLTDLLYEFAYNETLWKCGYHRYLNPVLKLKILQVKHDREIERLVTDLIEDTGWSGR